MEGWYARFCKYIFQPLRQSLAHLALRQSDRQPRCRCTGLGSPRIPCAKSSLPQLAVTASAGADIELTVRFVGGKNRFFMAMCQIGLGNHKLGIRLQTLGLQHEKLWV